MVNFFFDLRNFIKFKKKEKNYKRCLFIESKYIFKYLKSYVNKSILIAFEDINLDDEVKTDYHNHEIIVELVNTNEDKKKIAREKYLYYKNNKLNVKHENL